MYTRIDNQKVYVADSNTHHNTGVTKKEADRNLKKLMHSIIKFHIDPLVHKQQVSISLQQILSLHLLNPLQLLKYNNMASLSALYFYWTNFYIEILL